MRFQSTAERSVKLHVLSSQLIQFERLINMFCSYLHNAVNISQLDAVCLMRRYTAQEVMRLMHLHLRLALALEA